MQVKNLSVVMVFCYQNCSSDLKIFAKSRPSASNFKSFSRSLEQFFLTVGLNNFGNKIPFIIFAALELTGHVFNFYDLMLAAVKELLQQIF